MATTIVTKNSTTAASVPSAGSLTQGELAVNVTDKRLFTKDSGGTVVEVGTNPSALTVGGAFAANGGATLGDASGDALTINSSAVSIPNGLNFDSNTFVIDATNNRVGVGTASPSAKLAVVSTDGATSLTKDTTTGSSSYSNFRLEADTYNANILLGNNSLGVYGGAKSLNITTSDGPICFFPNTVGSSSSERMRIDSSGNVGIGTSSPTAGGKLDVNGVAYFGTGDKVKIYSNNILQNAGTLDIGTIGSAACIFNTANTERMRIDSSGNLLVGTTAKLQDDNKFVVQGSGGNGGNGIGIFYNTGIDSSPSLVCSKGSTTTSSSARFIQFYAGGVATTAMGGIVGNGASNVQFASLSDAREKTNIQPISGSLEKVNALNPVEFDWIADGSHVKAGFVAQDVEQVFPEFVIENIANDGEEPRKGLTGGMTGGIVAHLVKAIQEQQAIITDLKSRIESLENK